MGLVILVGTGPPGGQKKNFALPASDFGLPSSFT
jgi:hypothetical protein